MIQLKSKLGKYPIVVGIIILVGLISYFFLYSSHQPYLVVEVIDGDTIKVKVSRKIETVRLIGIDTPEVSDCFGDKATERIKELLKDKKVYLLPDPLSSDRGKYDRLLRYVFLPSGLCLNATLIQEGYAFNYIYQPFQFMKQFDYLEKEARENRLGLWSDQCDYYFEIE